MRRRVKEPLLILPADVKTRLSYSVLRRLVASTRAVGRRAMKKTQWGAAFRSLVAVLCCAALMPGETLVSQSSTTKAPAAPPATSQAAKIPPDQLDSLVAPIALYPDPLLAQTLAAATYPLEIIQLQQWLEKNKTLKDKALADAVAKQPWDPSVQSMAGLPDVVKRLADDVQWTTDLGNAFLAQQSDVMEAVQRMRKKAQDSGNLKSNEQQKVETKVVESKQVIVVEQSNPQVVYVPSYNPTVVYGPPVYPYPPITYPPPGYYAAGMAISFGVGVAMGAMWGGGWGYGCGWGSSNVNVNVNNNFNRNTNIQGGNRVNNQPTRGGGNRGGGGGWQHNPQHRGGTPYGNKATAQKFGGTTRGSSAADRQASARQNISNRSQTGDRSGPGQSGNRAQTNDRSGPGQSGNRGQGSDRSGPGQSGNRAQAGTNDLNRGGDRGGGGGDRGGASGGDRVGNRSVSNSSSRGNAMGGSSGGAARASSSRGSSSMGGGGGSRSRGGGGGGGRRR